MIMELFVRSVMNDVWYVRIILIIAHSVRIMKIDKKIRILLVYAKQAILKTKILFVKVK